MPIVPAGSTNLAASQVPGVLVQIQPPNPLLNGVPTDIIGLVGTAKWGPVNSPTIRGAMTDYVGLFGNPASVKYDMGTTAYNIFQQSANKVLCVRVTDGTDEKSETDLLDESSAIGAVILSKYTGSLGNNQFAVLSVGSGSTTASPTYKLTLYFDGGVPEVFDNLGGTGVAFWSGLVNAVNLGQTQARGPSQICTAQLSTFISSVTVGTAGSYPTLPTLSTGGNGNGAVLAATMKAVSAVPAARGTGYVPADTITITGGTHTISSIFTVATTELATVAVNAGGANYLVGDTITLAGGTFSQAAILTVATVSGGAITGVTITNRGSYTVNTASFTQSATSGVGSGATFNTAVWGVKTVTATTAGAYTALPSNPAAQGSTSGSGTGCTLTVAWGLLSVQVTNGGSGYDSTSTLVVSGSGGATGTLNIGAAGIPEIDMYQLAGGLDGNTNVTDETLIGDDSATPRSGMYSLRASGASIGVLSDQDDPTYWTQQEAFGLTEGVYMIGTLAPNYYNDVAGAKAVKESAAVASYAFKLMNGDWCYINDPFNNVTRLTSPQGFMAGQLAVQSPSGSSLNKPMSGIVGTQKSAINQVYSDADLLFLDTAGIDVITRPIPASVSAFGGRLGVNTSTSVTTNGDNYTRMINFLAATFNTGLGSFIGLAQTPKVQTNARSTLQTFLQNLVTLGMIGTVDGSAPFKVILDSSNNPAPRVALGFMQADVQVTLFSIVINFVINLEAGQSVTTTATLSLAA